MRFDPQDPHKKLGAIVYTYSPCKGKAETGDSTQSCQIEVVSCRVSEEALP